MQGNNKLRVFSGNTSNYIADADLDGAPVQTGAVNGGVAASNLYNSLSLTTTLACTSLIDFVAQYNPSVTFGQTTPIETWITAVSNAIASKTSVDNIVNGTTTVGNAANVTTNINGKAISTIFESDGTTVKNATNSANATNVNITNLDSGNNAVVNFQLGNGTSYDKTINNVANANTVQNVNFSSSSSATFGNYTLPKIKIIYNTPFEIFSGASITLNENINNGDVLRLLIQFSGVHCPEYRYIKYNDISSANFSFSETLVNISSPSSIITRCVVGSITGNKIVALQSNMCTQTNTNIDFSDFTATIYEVAKII